MTVEVLNETNSEVDLQSISHLATFAMSRMKIHPQADLSIIFVDEDSIAELNKRWMDETGPTDVLSFPMDELRPGDDSEVSADSLLGDIVICPQVAATQAASAGKPAAEEIQLLLVHGFLHLLGFDHAEPAEHQRMFALQDQILAEWRAAA
ncbi:MAG: rRNA maturation RNase YbeY [Actinomycetota bacterium]|jgi:probable rRNA maturation factor